MNINTTNSPLDLKPKCKIVNIDLPKDKVIKTIQDNLIKGNDIAVGFLDTEDNHIELKVPTSQRHFWSPKMHVWIEDERGKTSLSCVVGPNKGIWNIFILFYFIAIVLTIIGIILGFIQKYNHETAYYFWAVPIGLMFLFGINLAARIGQYWGKTQVSQLKSFLSMCIDKKI